jgi:multidrug efflux pump subunit AcrB
VNGLVDLHDDMERGKPEVRVVVDREKAKLAGLSTQYIGATVQAAVHGRKAGEFRVGDDEYDVTVKFPEWFREDVSFLEGMSLVNPRGEGISFASVARLEYGVGPGTIKRIDRKRTVTVIGEAQDRPGSEVLGEVRERLADLPLPPGYTLSYTGERQNVDESAAFMQNAFVVALLLISLLLILQFNSIMQTLIIMSTVLLSLGGVFLGLLVFGLPFGFLMTGIGCISLSGIVVNNGIILVDFINVLRSEGVALTEAIVTASKLRLRPVLLTAGTTVLGLMPLTFGVSIDFWDMSLSTGGTQSAFWKSMAVALMFGLTFATMLTLLIVPVLYSLSVTVPERLFRRKNAPTPPMPDAEPVAK